MKKLKFPGFQACVAMMRKRNALTQEEGYHALLPRVGEFVPELMEEFRGEQDHGLRCWLLQLIGEARDKRTLDLLIEQLHSTDESLRYWAICGLQSLNRPESRKALFEAGVPRNRKHGPT